MGRRLSPHDAQAPKPLVPGEGVTAPFVCLVLLFSTAVFISLTRLSARKQRHASLHTTPRPSAAFEAAHSARDPQPAAVQVLSTDLDDSAKEPSPARAKAAQANFLRVLGLCYLADWMKGPYTIALFHSYGLGLQEMATLFVVGYIASLIFGTIAGAVADIFGRARTCRYFCALFAVSMLTKLSPNFWVLALGRAVGGVADSLLATAFEAWFVSAYHDQGHAFVRDTFVSVASYRSVAAVVAGGAAQLLATLFGNVAPFVAAVPIVAVAFFYMTGWQENYGADKERNVGRVLGTAASRIGRERRLQLLCLCEALFEACMYIWVFTWSSALDRTNRQSPFGLVFAVFMVAMMCGGVLGRLRTVGYWLPVVHAAATVAAALAALVFGHKDALLVSFCLTELAVGLYYATHPTLRAELVDNDTRSATMSLFRVPMNLIVFAVLQLHLTPRQNLGVLVFLQMASGACLYGLRRAGGVPS